MSRFEKFYSELPRLAPSLFLERVNGMFKSLEAEKNDVSKKLSNKNMEGAWFSQVRLISGGGGGGGQAW